MSAAGSHATLKGNTKTEEIFTSVWSAWSQHRDIICCGDFINISLFKHGPVGTSDGILWSNKYLTLFRIYNFSLLIFLGLYMFCENFCNCLLMMLQMRLHIATYIILTLINLQLNNFYTMQFNLEFKRGVVENVMNY